MPLTRVRLACVKHAASVQSEPGSNSSVQSLCKILILTLTNISPLLRSRLREWSSHWPRAWKTVTAFWPASFQCEYLFRFLERSLDLAASPAGCPAQQTDGPWSVPRAPNTHTYRLFGLLKSEAPEKLAPRGGIIPHKHARSTVRRDLRRHRQLPRRDRIPCPVPMRGPLIAAPGERA